MRSGVYIGKCLGLGGVSPPHIGEGGFIFIWVWDHPSCR
jgi:hypothetical protein